ncbi:hypothetical protein Y032_0007g3363 [Ancylostoma ceylanicum]|uniref:Uncharacterized protein n=1 Tax=Ancylostoma ceylanicum TaxID=53326 RepID=A0A016VM66_9BILA|nr:hypothetical protein Y032_0007g3363 [Ancylostoma ceylanicum]
MLLATAGGPYSLSEADCESKLPAYPVRTAHQHDIAYDIDLSQSALTAETTPPNIIRSHVNAFVDQMDT